VGPEGGEMVESGGVGLGGGGRIVCGGVVIGRQVAGPVGLMFLWCGCRVFLGGGWAVRENWGGERGCGS